MPTHKPIRIEVEALIIRDSSDVLYPCQVDVTPDNAPLEAGITSCGHAADGRITVAGESFYICAEHLRNVRESVLKLPPVSIEIDPRWR